MNSIRPIGRHSRMRIYIKKLIQLPHVEQYDGEAQLLSTPHLSCHGYLTTVGVLGTCSNTRLGQTTLANDGFARRTDMDQHRKISSKDAGQGSCVNHVSEP